LQVETIAADLREAREEWLDGIDAVAHLDCVMREATLELDGETVLVAGVAM